MRSIEKNNRHHLLVDVNYLCHRARFSTGSLLHEGAKIGVIFGVLRTLFTALEFLEPSYTVLAFDHPGKGKREELFPDYKKHRREKEKTAEEIEELKEFYSQVDTLRSEILPAIGFRNIWSFPGYEGDDILAEAARAIPVQETGTIATSDHDLYQAIQSNVRWWNPYTGEVMTFERFRAEWGILPMQWANVKAWAGCSTDGVPGLDRVGEKTAAKWVRGILPPTSKVYEKFLSGLDVHNRNLKLVTLPFPGLVLPSLVRDEITADSQRQALELIGARPARASARVYTKLGFDIDA